MIINRDLIGERFTGCTFDNFEVLSDSHRRALTACKSLLDGSSDGVVLTGPVGRGKTHLLVSLAYEFNKEARLELLDDNDYVLVSNPGNTVVFWPHIELSAALRRGFSDGTTAFCIEECKAADLLIIDELMSEGTARDGDISPYVKEFTEEIIEYRYSQEMAIAVSSNLGFAEMKGAYSPRVVSRLADMCGDCIILLDGDEDYRLKRNGRRNGKERS